MKSIPFLTEEEIQKLQEAETNSSKEQKKTAEQIEAIYTSGQNILVSASAGSGPGPPSGRRSLSAAGPRPRPGRR